ncbi:MAG: proline--tRNA ligase [Candidatus Latescibacteria bacterium]|nr:proline--tRNA ligase [Candidatus Latescibacterota bacterium]
MRYSHLFTQTLREAPSEAEAISHRLALRAGLIRPLAAGIFSYLPLGLRVKQKIEAIVRQEMAATDGCEVLMPVVQPSELWQESGRWQGVGPELMRLKDRSGREMCLGMTHEEAATDLARQVIRSHRQLPLSIFQVQTKFRDEPRSRGGLIRVREFTMKDAYSFHADEADLDRYYERQYRAYQNIFRRVGLAEAVIAVESDTGMMGGTQAHEFIYLNPIGEDTLLICDACGYRANRQVAVCAKEAPEAEALLPLRDVATPGCRTIADLAAFLKVPTRRTAKAVFLAGTVAGKARLVFAVVRGDCDLNETKLANAVGASDLRPATEEEIRAVGAEPGYGSPVGLSGEALVVVDDRVAGSRNLVAGANREGVHSLNVNVGRDFQPGLVTDLVAVSEGMPCPRCCAPLRSARGIEVGNIFKLGTRYSERMGATFLDEGGKARPLVMGCYGLGIDRLLACLIEAHHDDRGIVWPAAVAPFQVCIVVVNSKTPKGEAEAAEKIYQALWEAGVEALLDDRDERAGVKFNDADLIGIPLRVTIGARGLEKGCAEVKRRREEGIADVRLEDLVAHVKGEIEGRDPQMDRAGRRSCESSGVVDGRR